VKCQVRFSRFLPLARKLLQLRCPISLAFNSWLNLISTLIWSINDNTSRTLRRFALDCVSCARCARDPNGLLGNSVGKWQDGQRHSRPHSARVSLDFVGTLFAHQQTHDIAKLAIRRPGLAYAGSVCPINMSHRRLSGPIGADRPRNALWPVTVNRRPCGGILADTGRLFRSSIFELELSRFTNSQNQDLGNWHESPTPTGRRRLAEHLAALPGSGAWR
jgi:hypothetical protein